MDVLGLKERNVDHWWSQADDPIRPVEVFSEVSQHTCSKGTVGGASGSNAKQKYHHLYHDILYMCIGRGALGSNNERGKWVWPVSHQGVVLGGK